MVLTARSGKKILLTVNELINSQPLTVLTALKFNLKTLKDVNFFFQVQCNFKQNKNETHFFLNIRFVFVFSP